MVRLSVEGRQACRLDRKRRAAAEDGRSSERTPPGRAERQGGHYPVVAQSAVCRALSVVLEKARLAIASRASLFRLSALRAPRSAQLRYVVSRLRPLRFVGGRSWTRRLIISRSAAPATRRSSAIAARSATVVAPLSFGVSLTSIRSALAAVSATLVHAGSALQHFFSTGGENGLECFDPVVGRLEKEVLHHRFGPLELRYQHLRVSPARHFTAYFRYHTITAGPMQDHNDAAFSRLHEIGGLGPLMLLRDPRWPPAFPFRHSFGHLPERRF